MMFRLGVFEDARVIAALRAHFDAAHANTVPGSAHALDIAGLQRPEIRFWSMWDQGALLGVGAWKRFDGAHAEVKSMYVVEALRRRGVGGQILRHLIADARDQGVRKVWLETGSWDYFRPAVELYLRHGFAETGPFGDYRADPNSLFMVLALDD